MELLLDGCLRESQLQDQHCLTYLLFPDNSNEDWIDYRINDLARMLQQLGESQFQFIWREATGEECAGEVREVIWTARDELG
ncbi:hypothetical protein [Nostoc punctiforme]|uniref:hypothetical protein n=1 Tax=Nostoc punctiforme TaxID=272131 RepID=UPI000038D87E|nr:hypothetical protein [Nostoc punctiforme]